MVSGLVFFCGFRALGIYCFRASGFYGLRASGLYCFGLFFGFWGFRVVRFKSFCFCLVSVRVLGFMVLRSSGFRALRLSDFRASGLYGFRFYGFRVLGFSLNNVYVEGFSILFLKAR